MQEENKINPLCNYDRNNIKLNLLAGEIMKITGVGRAVLMALGIAILAGCGVIDICGRLWQTGCAGAGYAKGDWDIQGAGRNTV